MTLEPTRETPLRTPPVDGNPLREEPALVAVPATARDFLANERTFLAYARTALAFLGFGFVIARFSLFSREVGIGFQSVEHPGVSVTLGIVMALLGILIGAYGAKRYIDTDTALRKNAVPALSPRAAMFVTGIIAVFGGLIAIALYRLR
jgi:putative membrane protein